MIRGNLGLTYKSVLQIEETPIEEQSKEALIGLIYDLWAKLTAEQEKLDLLKETQDKFLAVLNTQTK